jgi:hypothetical protein
MRTTPCRFVWFMKGLPGESQLRGSREGWSVRERSYVLSNLDFPPRARAGAGQGLIYEGRRSEAIVEVVDRSAIADV